MIFNNQYQQESVNLSLNQKSSTESLGAIMGSIGLKKKNTEHPLKKQDSLVNRVKNMNKIY